MYQLIGYNVHPQKTYVSRKRAEFLRSYETGRAVTGFLARPFTSIMYHNPKVALPIVRSDRMRARVDNWVLVRCRGGDAQGVVHLLEQDVAQFGFSLQELSDYCFTPRTLGGGGWDVGLQDWRRIYASSAYHRERPASKCRSLN